MLFSSLETERMQLKNIERNDRDFIFSQFSDSTVNRYLFDAEPLSCIDGADEIIDLFLQPEPRTQHRWILLRKADNIKMGTCGFHCWDINSCTVEVGYDLKEAFWGNGYMQEALKAIILFAKNNMKVKEIRACIYPKNTKSVSIAEKAGFRFSGETKNEIFRGKEYLHKIYSLDCSIV